MTRARTQPPHVALSPIKKSPLIRSSRALRPRRKIPPPTSSVNATAPRVEAEPPKRHPAGRSSCPRLGLALVTEPGCVYGHVAAHPYYSIRSIINRIKDKNYFLLCGSD